MANRRGWLKDAWDEIAEACGFRDRRGPGNGRSDLRLVVSVQLPHGKRQLVGTHSQEDGEFVFRYDPSFVKAGGLPPISEFPQVDREYRSKDLWAFFEARLPPVDRKDIKELLEHGEGRIAPGDILRVLGRVSKRTIANPYELELAGPALAR